MEITPVTSVGIDIGTSTTKMIVSHLLINSTSNPFSIPTFEISDRIILFQSDIISTPLLSKDEIDVERIAAWLKKQYVLAGIRVPDIKSGAVIITGETANKRNAEKMIHFLAERAGDFVVAIAGANLEAVLAGKGSGAFQYSIDNVLTVVNIDIGGGTANAVYMRQGEVVASVTFLVGGRLIEMNEEGKILHVSDAITPWLEKNNYRLQKGEKVSFVLLQTIIQHLCENMVTILMRGSFKKDDPLIHSYTTTTLPSVDAIFISGGIGALRFYPEPQSISDIAVYQDVGPLITCELQKTINNYQIKQVPAEQTSRATVIGAGMQSTEISGSTIYADRGRLPIRNIPVLTCEIAEDTLQKEKTLHNTIYSVLLKGKEMYPDFLKAPFAIHILGNVKTSYLLIKQLAITLNQVYQALFPKSDLMIIVCEQDMAKALGQAIKVLAGGRFDLICIDQVQVKHGDFLDIGEMIHQSTVPVVVKTLAFS
ncbi:ethanolamine ammonia-lyase reactivating factor EutA [Aquibacillus albus]|uniref:Ethanolamine utilization protein EutA n=1 Tax=Aquibacillus albus TaxID=1168171 RepID=A0ABS2MWB9_9BACI|nr:ethanolamine ammonia-lyase reactivating factor EutA [Aquibacillus albus]MBM7570187.1 ethanolamine utilization protein EutA [Aquibacillus albus]